MNSRFFLLPLLVFPWGLQATQTENNTLHILPAPGAVKIDGKFDDWDLSGGIFACDNVERLRDQFSVSFYAMSDKENLYLLAKVKDMTPLNSDQSSKGGHGFSGDCLQVRFLAGYKTPDERVSHWTCWRDRDGIDVLDVQYGRDFKGLRLPNAINDGAKQAFLVDADGKGYAQEIAIPWKLLTASGKPLEAGESLRMAIEPNFTAGPGGRVNIHDIFRAGVVPDRVFTFRAYDQWGEGVVAKSGHMKTPDVRLSDERTFPIKCADGYLLSDWKGLIQKQELPGFKAISFNVPADGFVSLNIKNDRGEVVRQLLTENFFQKGPQEVKWDGLTTPHYKTPGVPVEPGKYTWEAIGHPAFNITFRGWADHGGSFPWNNGPRTDWGGDHGVPDAVVADQNMVYLGWSFAEGGRPILGCDLDGVMIWKAGSGIDSAEHLALDGQTLFALGNEDGSCRRITRLRAKDGVYDNWDGLASASLLVSELWADQTEKGLWPLRANGMDAKNGKLYLTFSDQTIYPADIADWKGLTEKLMSGDPLAQRIYSKIDARTTQRLKGFLEGKVPQEDAFRTWAGGPRFDTEVVKELNLLLASDDFAPGTAQMNPVARLEANRKALESAFAPSLLSRKSNFIAMADAKSGKILKTFEAQYPQAVHALSDGRIAFISDGASLLALDPASGKISPIISGLGHATNFTCDADGKIYVSVAGADQQIKIFTADGKPAGTIGRTGGHALVGKWQPEGMYSPSAVAVDNVNHRLWVAEADFYPKRFSVWDLPGGKLAKDFFGPAHYGASGGAINPLDPNTLVGIGAEWKLDPATGRAALTGILERATHGFAVFCPASNGRLYLAAVTNFGVHHGPAGLRIFERIGEGDYRLRAEWKVDFGTQTTAVWSDINGDAKQDANEVTTLPYPLHIAGSNLWSANINPSDFTVFAGIADETSSKFRAKTALRSASDVKLAQTVFAKVYQIKPDGFTGCGAPKWDLQHPVDLPDVWSIGLQSGGFGMSPSKDNRLLLAVESADFKCHDLAHGKVLWSYPNTFYQVHGSHAAPPPVPGLTRGAFGLVGTFSTPETGTVWTINGNCGEWYLLSEKGFFLGHLFQGDTLKVQFPDQAVPGADMTQTPCGAGGEDFGGSLTQGQDGKIYIQAGDHSYRNLLVTGLDKVAGIGSGKVEITPDDIKLARAQQESQMQAAIGTLRINAKHLSPTLTGNPGKDFAGSPPVQFQKNADSAVRANAAWDDQNLYLSWDVTDGTPWINGAPEAAQMYVGGDTVDFQFGSDPKANAKRSEAVKGDFRLSIGNLSGKPAAVLYRAVSAVKKPKSFSSGIVAKYEMEYVDVVPDAKIVANMRPDKKGYIVEAAIPWSALGFTPAPGEKYQGDIGVTHGDAGGSRTALRTYWSNQETGLVNDVVYELKMVPKNWGDIVFEK